MADTRLVRFCPMDILTINEAAQTTGWSARMLRYVELVGLVDPARSAGGYRLYGPAELQRLRTLRELLDRHDLALSDMAFAQRTRSDPELRADVNDWFTTEPQRPEEIPAEGWLRFEQEKHQRLLAVPGSSLVQTTDVRASRTQASRTQASRTAHAIQIRETA